ncbi:MAG: hypothetical protein AAF380_02360 [Bacteroidota bacterium]
MIYSLKKITFFSALAVSLSMANHYAAHSQPESTLQDVSSIAQQPQEKKSGLSWKKLGLLIAPGLLNSTVAFILNLCVFKGFENAVIILLLYFLIPLLITGLVTYFTLVYKVPFDNKKWRTTGLIVAHIIMEALIIGGMFCLEEFLHFPSEGKWYAIDPSDGFMFSIVGLWRIPIMGVVTYLLFGKSKPEEEKQTENQVEEMQPQTAQLG